MLSRWVHIICRYVGTPRILTRILSLDLSSELVDPFLTSAHSLIHTHTLSLKRNGKERKEKTKTSIKKYFPD